MSLIHHQRLSEVVAKTGAAFVAEVLSAKHETEGFWRKAELVIKPTEGLFGLPSKRKTFRCVYSQGMPHWRQSERGRMLVSPLVSGSGIEFDIVRGDRAIFLAESFPPKGPCTALRVESMENKDVIIDFYRQQTQQPR